MITKIRTTIAMLAAALTVAVAVAPASADAQPIKGTTVKGCPVEDEHGNTTYVPVGTRIGLFVCGRDGEWHFGWLITERVAQVSTGTGAVADAPLRTARP